MRHTLPITPQFYVTAPQPCPYLAGRMERKLFTSLQGDYAEQLNNALSGSYGDKVMLLYSGGAACIVAGLFVALKK